MDTITIPKKQYQSLMERALRYDYLAGIISKKENIFASPPTRVAERGMDGLGETQLYSTSFWAGLEKGLKRSDYFNEGNENLILCLRGIRTFEQIDSKFMNTPDFTSILELKEKSRLKVMFDPSHAAGNANYVRALSKAAIDLGADGLMVEYHYSPGEALIDGKQSVDKKEFAEIIKSVNTIRI